MGATLTEDVWRTIRIPKDSQAWFAAYRRLPVRCYFLPSHGIAQVEGGDPYRIHAVKKGHYQALRTIPSSGTVLCVGEFSKNGVHNTLSDAATHDLRVFRAVMLNTTYPGYVAYLMRNNEYTHLGECYDKHPETIILKNLYLDGLYGKACAVCGEKFE